MIYNKKVNSHYCFPSRTYYLRSLFDITKNDTEIKDVINC